MLNVIDNVIRLTQIDRLIFNKKDICFLFTFGECNRFLCPKVIPFCPYKEFMIITILTLAWPIGESRVGAEEHLLSRAEGNTSFKI